MVDLLSVSILQEDGQYVMVKGCAIALQTVCRKSNSRQIKISFPVVRL